MFVSLDLHPRGKMILSQVMEEEEQPLEMDRDRQFFFHELMMLTELWEWWSKKL